MSGAQPVQAVNLNRPGGLSPNGLTEMRRRVGAFQIGFLPPGTAFFICLRRGDAFLSPLKITPVLLIMWTIRGGERNLLRLPTIEYNSCTQSKK